MIDSGTERREIPSGTVTFLFSDIEGSTQRWEQHHAAMADAVRRHDAIMRTAIESHAGYVFKTIGDAFCAAFANAYAAIAAAFEAQRAISADEWLSVDGLRVRMAIHTGSTDERDGDYFGPAVNRVARLLAVAHGGQVITSGVSADLLQGQMPPQTSLRDLGAHRLKDLTLPEQVYQLVSPELRSDFPLLRSLDTYPNNLPRTITSFVGREDDIREIKALVGKSDLVTLIGTGGVGKTRTALQIAADLLDNTADGAWFVELAPIADPSLLASTIVSAIGAGESSERAPLDVLLAHLKERQLLLVLDNCEHVVAEAARIADAIVRNCRRVKILATSREALNVSGEHIYRTPSMTLPARGERITAAQGGTFGAVALFVERAEAADGKFTLTDENVDAVVDICRRLDGIALAIELAAPRIKVLSVQQLAQRLDERFRILTGGSRSALPRQQTMRALIDWSYDLLSESEKTIFRRLSIFAGGCTIESASEICSDETIESWDVLDILSTLVDKSLIAAELHGSHQRYRLLESMRQYARERLDGSPDGANVARRHGEYFTAMGMRLEHESRSIDERRWLEMYEPEIDNFRLAYTWTIEGRNDVAKGVAMASALHRLFQPLALSDEAVRWYDAIFSSGIALSTLEQARMEYARGFLLRGSQRVAMAAAASGRAVALFRQTDDSEGLTMALLQTVWLYAVTQREQEAREIATEAFERARASNDRLTLARALQYCAEAIDANDFERSRAMYAESLSLYRAIGREADRANALMWFAEFEAKCGDYARAIELATESLEARSSSVPHRALMMSNLIGYTLATDDAKISRETLREALDVVLAVKQHDITANLVAYAGSFAYGVGRPQDAARLLGYAGVATKSREAAVGPTEQVPRDRLFARLTADLGTDGLVKLMNEGAEWTEEQAVTMVRQL